LDRVLADRFRALRDAAPGALRLGRKGLEKEALRVTPAGRIAHTPHPRALGSALTHPGITTDYSEALIELVTPPCVEAHATLDALDELHAFVHRHLGSERLWATSMPCIVEGDADVPVAYYGRSNSGTMRRVYRIGLGHRYGRTMQTIAGVHYNYSAPDAFWPLLEQSGARDARGQDAVSAHNLALVRNFRRAGWLTLYLHGASPAVCPSFVRKRPAGLEPFGEHTLVGPHATSLRMSDLGYKNSVQARLSVSANSLDEYIDNLTGAITTPWPAYEKIGVRVDGEYRQLNANLLQIENEYYSLVRPKRRTRPCERPTHALRRGGVQYVEMRSLDVDPFEPRGIGIGAMYLLEALALWCLLHDSPPIDAAEQAEIDHNQQEVARYGRRPGCTLRRRGRTIALADWAREICDELGEIAQLLDTGLPERPWTRVIAQAQSAIADPDLTPSARVLAELRARDESFIEFAQRRTTAAQGWYRDSYRLAPERLAVLEEQARKSLEAQARLEAEDSMSFDDYVACYYSGAERPCDQPATT
jgi:glutamate--cysteine ligase